MTHYRRLWIYLLPLLLASLACQAALGPWQKRFASSPTPSITASHTPTSSPLLPSPTSSLTASPLPPSPTPSPTATLLPPSPTPFVVAGPRPTASPSQLQVFEELWQIVNEQYLYPDFNGLDWNAIHGEYRSLIEGGLTNDEFYLAMKDMIARLGDDHSNYFSPEEARKLDANFAGDYNFVGIGVTTAGVPDEKRATILLVFPGSPAEAAGLQSHDSILAIDGQPIWDESGFHRERLLGPEGSTVEVTVQTPGQEPRQVQLTRRRIVGQLPVPHTVLTSPGGKRIGYIFLPTFGDSNIDDQVGQAIREMTVEAPLDGLILDNRYNGGGMVEVMANTLTYFTNGVVGYFVQRGSREPLTVPATDVNGSQNVPLVTLVGKGTASFGEIFAGLLKDIGRAYLIGEQTEGNVEILGVHELTDASRAWIANATFHPINQKIQNWEQTGIVPDLTVVSNWDEVTLANDLAILAALAHFDGQ